MLLSYAASSKFHEICSPTLISITLFEGDQIIIIAKNDCQHQLRKDAAAMAMVKCKSMTMQQCVKRVRGRFAVQLLRMIGRILTGG